MREWLDTPLACEPAGTDLLALAWALKDACYEAWGREPARAARAAEVLRTLLDSGVPVEQADEIEALADWTAAISCATRGQMAEAIEHLDRAAAAFRQAGQPDPAAQTQVPKIMALSMLGRHDDAERCAEATQRELVALGNLGAASRVSLNLGGLHLRRDHYAQAARHYREAAVLFARISDHEHSILADIGVADALTALGDFDEARLTYARARMRASNRHLAVRVALADESAALLDLAQGRYREALAGLEAARRAYETLALPQPLAIAEKQLADAYLELRLLPEALALFAAAVAKFGALDSPDEQAWALAQRGRTEALLGQAGADASLAQAAALFAAQGNEVGRATVALARGELALSHGEAGAALQWAEQAVAGFTAAGQTDGSSRAEVVCAQALLALGRHGEAGRAFDAGLQRARALQQLSVQVRCLTGQGLVAQAVSDPKAAARAFDAAIELFEDQRRTLPDDDMRSAFITEHLRPYQERLRIALASATGDGLAAAPRSADTALLHLDRFRARALDERLSEGHGADADASLQALRERLDWLYRRTQRLQEEGGSSAALNHERLRTEHELLELARRQRLAAPQRISHNVTHGVTHGADDLDVAALQAALQDGDALVEYGVLDDELFACVVTRGKVALVRHMALWSSVLAAAQSARFQLETLRHGRAPVQRHLATLVARTQARMVVLHGLVWSPLTGELAGCRRVIVVPHAQLSVLPFAAFSDGSTPLGERFELALAPSARLALRGLLRPAAPARRVLALGESSRLAHTAREAEFVAGLFDTGTSFVGEQATLALLRAHAPAADVLHLACHAEFRSDNPRFSALHLHAGALTVEGAESLALKPCTVVLSACETGLNATSAGDEMVGLVRAFMVAGAARVVASLWPVEDEITVRFMAQFYAALVRGEGAASALQLAQMAIRRAHPHPYCWAAFVLYGGW